ncbi:MAG: hypothetical protein K8T91_24775 [Planctomycetes bacterium]|nr:hypothetical protein [Planctomycetota bacterium]
MNGELEDLIARHFDGHLDAAGQQRLAELLAASAEARQTFARYLRLEGGAIKLASVSQLGQPSAEEPLDVPDEQTPPEVEQPSPSSLPNQSRPRWDRVAWLAAAASLLVAVLLSQWMIQAPQQQQVAHAEAVAELNRLSENWLQLQEEPLIEEPASADAALPDPSFSAMDGGSEPELVEPEPEADSVAPPSWMIAAMADLAIDKSNPDEE